MSDPSAAMLGDPLPALDHADVARVASRESVWTAAVPVARDYGLDVAVVAEAIARIILRRGAA